MSDPMSYHWRRSPRAKQLQVRITPWQGVEVVIPSRTSRQRVRTFLIRQRQWIRATWERMQSQVADADLRLPDKLDLRALGEHWVVRYHSTSGVQAHVTVNGRTLYVNRRGLREAACREALRSWLASHARKHLGMKAQRMSSALACHYQRLQIRGQTSRWGSCSSNGTLSLNYKLLFLEPELVRYLLIHELMHLRVLDHSERFWKLVSRHEPEWRSLDEQLGEAWRDIPAWVELD